MFLIILILALLLSVFMIVMVLLQPSKGGGITQAFGGIGGQLGSTFGQRRTLEALGKGTTYTAVAIAALCILANVFFVPTGSPSGPTPVTQGVTPNNSVPQSLPPANLDNSSSAPATGGANEGGATEGGATDGGAANETPATVPAEGSGN